MIGAADDLVKRISTNREKISPRDNVYLEYGLFSGFLAPKRVLLLIHQDCSPASDLAGMSLLTYSNITDAIQKAHNWIADLTSHSATVISRKDIELLPTVGIAVGYYDNFVNKFVYELRSQVFSKSNSDFLLNIYVPTFLTKNVNDYTLDLIDRLNLEKDTICNFRILKSLDTSNILNLYDVPTTITALFKTVDYIFGVDGNSEDMNYAKLRALDNFCDTLSILIKDNLSTRNKVKIIRYSEFD